MKSTKNKEENRGKKNVRVRLLTMAAVICIIVSVLAGTAFADPGDPKNASGEAKGVKAGAFEVTDYDFTAVVSKDHSYQVEEKISVNIPDQLQKIEFAIPSGNFRISGIRVDGAEFKVNKASEASTVSITDPGMLSEGAHEYTIRYRIQEYLDRDSAKDMFYFDVLLPEWRQPIGKVSIAVSFPEDFPWDDMQCYAGQFGVQDVTNKISFKASESKHTVKVTGSMIPENFGITLKAQLPEGYWEGALSGNWAAAASGIIMAIASLILLVLWVIGGRDPKVRRLPQTKPLDGLSPVELGYVFNGKVRTRDVLHLIIQFAQNGYLRISEYEPKKYRLYKVSSPKGEERMFRNAYKILFEDVYKGRALEMDRIAPRIARIRSAIEDDVAAGFAAGESSPFTPVSRMFRYVGAAVLGIGLAAANAVSYSYDYQPPRIIESLLVGVAAAAASLLLCRVIDLRDSISASAGLFAECTSSFLFALPVLFASYRITSNTGRPYAALPVVLAASFAEFLIVIMRARGKENAVLVSRIRRLRNFIYHPTPKELLENHLADSDYYYDMMIYALAFGAEESWAISFLTLDVPEPDWYTDDIEGHAFTNLREEPTTIDYARDIRSFIRTFEAS